MDAEQGADALRSVHEPWEVRPQSGRQSGTTPTPVRRPASDAECAGPCPWQAVDPTHDHRLPGTPEDRVRAVRGGAPRRGTVSARAQLSRLGRGRPAVAPDRGP